MRNYDYMTDDADELKSMLAVAERKASDAEAEAAKLAERLKEAERLLRMIASNEKYWGNSAAVKDFLAGVPPLSQQPSTPPTLTAEERKTLESFVAEAAQANILSGTSEVIAILARELLSRQQQQEGR